MTNHFLPPLRVSDELTELDNRFRQMANSIDKFKKLQDDMLVQPVASSRRDELQTVLDTLPSALFITDEKWKSQNRSINMPSNCSASTLIISPTPLKQKRFVMKKEMQANFMPMLLRDATEDPIEKRMEAMTADREVVPVKVSITPFNLDNQKKFLTVVWSMKLKLLNFARQSQTSSL